MMFMRWLVEKRRKERGPLRIFGACLLLVATPGVAMAEPGGDTACLALQGNGDHFSSLLGAAVALLERGVHPALSFGGSSSSVVAPLVQAVLANVSVRNSVVVGLDGRALGVPQKAALVLASISPMSESLLLLPSLVSFSRLLRNVAHYVVTSSLADAFVGHPDRAMVMLEPITGQNVLGADFLQHTDFRPLLALPTVPRRTQWFHAAWFSFAELISVTPAEFLEALTLPKSHPAHTARVADIKHRFFGLLRAENAPASQLPNALLKKHERWLERHASLLERIPAERKLDLFLKMLEPIRSVPFVGSLALQLSRPFDLPNPSVVWRAYLGLSKATGKVFPLPPGTVLHSTARVAEFDSNRGLVDKQGLENLALVYFVPKSEAAAFRDVLAQYPSDEGPMSFQDPNTNTLRAVVPAGRMLVYGNASLSKGMRASIAEPNAIRRMPIVPGDEEIAAYASFLERGPLLGFGGWLDHVPMKTLSAHPACRNVDWLVTVANPTEGLRGFQRKAVRAVVEGRRASVLRKVKREDPLSLVHSFLDGLFRVYKESLLLEGRLGSVVIDFNWDDPIPGNDTDAVSLATERAVLANRSALFLASYQHARAKLAEKMGVASAAQSVLERELGAFSVLLAATPADVVVGARQTLGLPALPREEEKRKRKVPVASEGGVRH
jgi:hypothetical protein